MRPVYVFMFVLAAVLLVYCCIPTTADASACSCAGGVCFAPVTAAVTIAAPAAPVKAAAVAEESFRDKKLGKLARKLAAHRRARKGL